MRKHSSTYFSILVLGPVSGIAYGWKRDIRIASVDWLYCSCSGIHVAIVSLQADRDVGGGMDFLLAWHEADTQYIEYYDEQLHNNHYS